MAEKYVVAYKNEKIGELTIEENTYVYVPDKDKIMLLEKNGERLLNLLKEETQETTIPFFESRIKNCKRFNAEKIGYHTDFYSLILIDGNKQAKV